MGPREVMEAESAQEAPIGRQHSAVGFTEGILLSGKKWGKNVGARMLRKWYMAQVPGIRGMWWKRGEMDRGTLGRTWDVVCWRFRGSS